MRMILALGCCVAAVGAAAAQEPGGKLPEPGATKAPASSKAPELPKAMVGVWTPTSIQSDGAEQLDAQGAAGIVLSIENGQHKLFFLTDPAKMEGKRIATSALAVDEKAGTFEMVINEGVQKKGEKVHGLYEAKGDSLRLCYGPADKPRPTAFAAPKDQPGVFNETWTRYKKK